MLRGTIDFRHPFLPITVGSISQSNRATYAQIVIYGRDTTVAESVHPLGQSGMITLAGQLDPHFADQLPLFGVFEYKPMLLMEAP